MPYGKFFARIAEQLPAVLILHEKHDDSYFHIPDLDTLARRSVEILRYRRDKTRYYGPPGGKRPERPFEEEVDSLPEPLRKEAKRQLHEWTMRAALWDDQTEEWAAINKAVEKGDGEAAWEILSRRSSAEYERIELRAYSRPYKA